MTYYNWRDFFLALERWGFSDVLLPFLLIFTIVYAVFRKTKILGDKSRFDVIIAFVLAMATIVPHVTGSYPLGYNPVLILQKALPTVSIVVVALIMLLLLIGVWGAQSDWVAANTITGGIVLLSVVAIVWIFGAAANWWAGWGWFHRIFGADATAIVVMILVFGLVLWFITREEKTTEGDNLMKQVGNMFRKD